MVSKKLKVVNSQGFHMRPATEFVQGVSKYSSEVKLLVHGSEVNGKSLMNIIAACIKFGDDIEIQCTGEDETAALNEAVSLIESGLGEE